MMLKLWPKRQRAIYRLQLMKTANIFLVNTEAPNFKKHFIVKSGSATHELKDSEINLGVLILALLEIIQSLQQ